jgi:hypothetical protein
VSLDGMTPQRSGMIVCQICGRSSVFGAKYFLNQPHHDILGFRVQRCPQHWTNWALYNTREGRTNENRRMMAEAKLQPVPALHAYVEPWSAPYPTKERPE